MVCALIFWADLSLSILITGLDCFLLYSIVKQTLILIRLNKKPKSMAFGMKKSKQTGSDNSLIKRIPNKFATKFAPITCDGSTLSSEPSFKPKISSKAKKPDKKFKYTKSQLTRVTPKSLLAKGHTLNSIADLGATISQLKELNATREELVELGATYSQLEQIGLAKLDDQLTGNKSMEYHHLKHYDLPKLKINELVQIFESRFHNEIAERVKRSRRHKSNQIKNVTATLEVKAESLKLKKKSTNSCVKR